MIAEPVVDTASLVREIEAEVARRRAAGDYPQRLLDALHAEFSIPEADDLPELLAVVNTVFALESNRRPRRVIIGAKRLIRKLLAWYIQPIAVGQTRFNHAILHELRAIERRLARVETPWISPPNLRRLTRVSPAHTAVASARVDAVAPLLASAPAGPILLLGECSPLREALEARGLSLVDRPDGGGPSHHRFADPISELERAAPHSLGGVVMAGVLPRLSAMELLRIIPMAVQALRTGGVLVADAPDPDHPLAPRDPSGVDPAMRRWVSGETIALLCEAAGLTSIAHRVIAADGAASWIAVSAVRAATDARPGGE